VKVRFGTFTLDTDRRQLLSAEAGVHLSVKAFDLLAALVEQRPNVVAKKDLHARLWPDTHVVEANLAVLIGEVRRALADSADEPRFVRTVHRIGYAFCADVQPDAATARRADSSGDSRFWLAVDGRALMLSEGENVIGRDPRCDVWMDVDGVSRRHALIRIDRRTDEVVLEDLSSTNGTFVGRTRITSPRVLKDGDVIRIGSATIAFRTWSEQGGTETKRIRGRKV
jgi:DNA-binding winged helix-turn-helix (wHTH) protein